jgi:4-carboxymuconolactone decarboxylase
MDKKMHDKGLEVRKAVLGEAYVNNALKNVDDFNRPFQEMLNEYCWGTVWGREELPRKTRSMLNIAMIAILNRQHEFRAHLKGALTNGVTREEIREILMQVAIYGGWSRRAIGSSCSTPARRRSTSSWHVARKQRPRQGTLPTKSRP